MRCERSFRNTSITFSLACALLLAAPLAAQRIERPALAVSGYVIDAEIDTATHHLAAKAVVTFTAPENAEVGQLRLSSGAEDHQNHRRGGQAAHRRALGGRHHPHHPGHALCPGPGAHWTFEYEGMITGNEDGPIEGLKLAAIQEPITYLLYPARWFPMTGYLTNRFTAEMHIRVPQGMRVFASGSTGRGQAGDAGQRQARRPVRLQLDEARLSRHGDCRPLCGSGLGRPGQREGLSDGEPPGSRATNWRRRRPRSTTFLPIASARRRRAA